MGENEGRSTGEHEEIICMRCKVKMTEHKEELQIPFHGEDVWYYYICPVCKLRYE